MGLFVKPLVSIKIDLVQSRPAYHLLLRIDMRTHLKQAAQFIPMGNVPLLIAGADIESRSFPSLVRFVDALLNREDDDDA